MAPTYTSDIQSRREKTLFLLGGYTDKSVLAHAPAGGEGEGLYSVLFDPELGCLKTLASSNIKTNPAFIMKHPTLDIVYMTTEVISDGGSEILVGELNRKSGTVTVVDRKLVHGRSTCHIEWDSDRTHLIAVSYWDSRITTFPVDGEGHLGEATAVYADPGADYVDKSKPDRWEHLAHRQRWPHLHQVNRDPYSKKFFMVPDLGRDQIHMFNICQGKVIHLGAQQLRKGAGPRHMEFNKGLQVVYICGELDNTITVLKYNPECVSRVMKGGYAGDATATDQSDSLLTSIQTISTVPEGLDRKSTIAEMRLHPSGKYIYVGNRGHNSIAIFKVNPNDGTLTKVDIQDSLGAFPRHFNFDNTAQFLIVGNHASDTIVAFRILDTGKLVMVDKMDNIPSIVWVTPVTHEE